MIQRSIPLAIVLSFVTCGIYGLYWLVMLDTDSRQLADDNQGVSGAMVVVLSIVTCGIFMVYWSYIMGKRMSIALERADLPAEDRSIIYLVLSILGFGLINYALIQNDINMIIQKNG